MKISLSKFRSRHNWRGTPCGWTLPELMVAVAIGGIVLTAIGTFTVYGIRSFVAMSNYVDMDEKSRRTSDEMTRQIRQCTAVVDFKNTGQTRWITLSNTMAGATVNYIKYTWDSSTRTLSCEKTGQPSTSTLTECDDWEVRLCKRNPIPGTTNLFHPATNIFGNLDFNIAKLVDMKWKCSRAFIGTALQTESVQTTQIVLRNTDSQ